MTDTQKPIVVHKNRRRAFWALVIILFMLPVSAWLVFLGLKPDRPEIGWSMVLFGTLGLLAFGGSAVLIVRLLRAPWHLALHPSHLALHTPAYDLEVPWEQVAGIAVDEVDRRPACVLVFEDPAQVVRGATFHALPDRPTAVDKASTMQARLEESFARGGYHLAIPGRILERGPDQLARLLAEARTGTLWQGEEGLP